MFSSGSGSGNEFSNPAAPSVKATPSAPASANVRTSLLLSSVSSMHCPACSVCVARSATQFLRWWRNEWMVTTGWLLLLACVVFLRAQKTLGAGKDDSGGGGGGNKGKHKKKKGASKKKK